jgi:regulator of sirC expression with transglutaminase-like and TPR domain
MDEFSHMHLNPSYGINRHQARQQLTRMLASNGPLELLEACFWVAAEEYPDLDVQEGVRRVHLLSGEGARRVHLLKNPFARLDGVQTYLYDELGFRGNEEEYDDPRNSFMNEVLDRKLGIPLTLSILFMEVARAAGFETRGVGLPGHFVIRLEFEGRSLLVDPYHRGRVITREDCVHLVSRTTGRPSLFRREQLEGIDERATLARMLLNLKHLYLKREDHVRALSAVERLLLINPEDPTEIRDRGFLNAQLGRPDEAVADLESYLEAAPAAPDADSVRGRVVWLRRRLSEMN